MVDDLLSPAALARRGLYRPDVVQDRIRRDREGREDHAYFIWNLLSQELWFRTFIDGFRALEPLEPAEEVRVFSARQCES